MLHHWEVEHEQVNTVVYWVLFALLSARGSLLWTVTAYLEDALVPSSYQNPAIGLYLVYGDKDCVIFNVDPNSEHPSVRPDFPASLETFAKVNP